MEKFVKERSSFINEKNDLDLAEGILDDLVELVGSEEDVEKAAEDAYNDLKSAYDADELEVYFEDEVPENLAMSALVVKLVNSGKIEPKDADRFIGKNSDSSEEEDGEVEYEDEKWKVIDKTEEA
jgi:hypothetical protein